MSGIFVDSNRAERDASLRRSTEMGVVWEEEAEEEEEEEALSLPVVSTTFGVSRSGATSRDKCCSEVWFRNRYACNGTSAAKKSG